MKKIVSLLLAVKQAGLCNGRCANQTEARRTLRCRKQGEQFF